MAICFDSNKLSSPTVKHSSKIKKKPTLRFGLEEEHV